MDASFSHAEASSCLTAESFISCGACSDDNDITTLASCQLMNCEVLSPKHAAWLVDGGCENFETGTSVVRNNVMMIQRNTDRSTTVVEREETFRVVYNAPESKASCVSFSLP